LSLIGHACDQRCALALMVVSHFMVGTAQIIWLESMDTLVAPFTQQFLRKQGSLRKVLLQAHL